MAEKSNYRKYVSDTEALSRYDAYQNRYRDSIRESDKVLIELIRAAVAGRPASLLDIGCSTGNLLRHIKRLIPDLRLSGADLSRSAIQRCEADAALADVTFHIHDLLNVTALGPFDIVVANAVTFLLDWRDLERAFAGIWKALESGGAYVGFEFMHSFAVQDLMIVETSELHPDGLRMHWRPIPRVEALLRKVGFDSVEFHPFELPIDLPFPGYEADCATYTLKDERGRRMAFRGVLYQPWCHLVARKA